MSENQPETTDTVAMQDSSDDTRKTWVTPTIDELPVNESQSTIAGIGGDAMIYS